VLQQSSLARSHKDSSRDAHGHKSEVAAHRQPGKREARWCGREDPAGDRGHAVAVVMAGHADGPEPPRGRELLGVRRGEPSRHGTSTIGT